jgi:hypothetical protein
MSSKKTPSRMTAAGLTRQQIANFLGIPVSDVKSNGPVPAMDDAEKRRRQQQFYSKYSKKG